jgi:hypothetical protein
MINTGSSLKNILGVIFLYLLFPRIPDHHQQDRLLRQRLRQNPIHLPV